MKAIRMVKDYIQYSWVELDEKEQKEKLEKARQSNRYYNEWMDYRANQLDWKVKPLTYKKYLEVKFSQIEHTECVATYMQDLTPQMDRRRSFKEQLIEKNNDYRRRWE